MHYGGLRKENKAMVAFAGGEPPAACEQRAMQDTA
jgi:hypothetical protein